MNPAQSGPDINRLTVRIERDFAVLESLREEWNQVAAEYKSPIHMTFDWLRIWWQFYGKDKELRVFIFHEGERIVGIVPIYLEVIGISPIKTRIAKLVGANVPPKVFNAPVDPGWSREVFYALSGKLFEDERVDLLSFGPISKEWSGQEGFRAAIQSGACSSRSVWHGWHVLTVFHLPGTFEEYIASLSKNERHTRQKKLRQLTHNHQVRTRVILGADASSEEFESFLAQHTAQWNVKGKRGHFDDWPSGVEFHRTLVRRLSNLGQVVFFEMLVDGQVVANRYCYLMGERLYAMLASRTMGSEWDRLGLGTTSYLLFIEAAIAKGVTYIHSGLGHYEYKVRLGGQEIEVGTWHITGPGSASRIKARLFLILSRVIMKVGYDLVYLRIMPRLPRWFGRPLSLTWLRFDVR